VSSLPASCTSRDVTQYTTGRYIPSRYRHTRHTICFWRNLGLRADTFRLYYVTAMRVLLKSYCLHFNSFLASSLARLSLHSKERWGLYIIRQVYTNANQYAASRVGFSIDCRLPLLAMEDYSTPSCGRRTTWWGRGESSFSSQILYLSPPFYIYIYIYIRPRLPPSENPYNISTHWRKKKKKNSAQDPGSRSKAPPFRPRRQIPVLPPIKWCPLYTNVTPDYTVRRRIRW